MKTKNIIIGGLVLTGIGVSYYFIRKKMKSEKISTDVIVSNPTSETTKDNQSVNNSSTQTVNTVKAPKVYANSKGVSIKLADAGITKENPIVLGKEVRVTENKGENIGTFIKYITIYAKPFALFTDSYSGRKVLISKDAVSIK